MGLTRIVKEWSGLVGPTSGAHDRPSFSAVGVDPFLCSVVYVDPDAVSLPSI
jgi:hypothetical protein